MTKCWFMNSLIKYLFIKAIRIIGDPDDWSSANWSSTVRVNGKAEFGSVLLYSIMFRKSV